MFLAASAALLAACEDGVTDITPPHGGNAAPTAVVTVTGGPFFRGVPVELSAASSADPDSDPLAYEWALLEAPEGSAASISGPDLPQAALLPDLTGVYTVRLVVTDGSSADTTTATVPVEVQQLGDITSDSVIRDTDSPAGSADYVILSTARWSAPTTIEPGVRIEFGPDTRLIIGSGGRLDAAGTQSEPIELVGAQDVTGFWQGIEIRSTDPANRLAHVRVVNGGVAGWAGVFVGGTAAIDSSVIRGSASYGVEVAGGGTLTGFRGNVLADNAVAAMRVPARVTASLDATSTFAGPVEVAGGAISSALSWPGIGAPFLVTGDLRVEAPLSIEAGARLEFDDGTRLLVETEGSLSAVGTADAPVRLVGSQDTSGHWYGVSIASTASGNHLRHVQLRNAGADAGAALLLTGSLAMDSTAIEASDGYGLRLGGAARLSTFFDNSFQDHDTAPVRLPVAQLGSLDAGTAYRGAVQVEPGLISDAQTWPATDSSLHFLGDVVVEAPVTAQPGAHVQLSAGGRIVVDEGGSLSAVGTPTDTIRFTGRQASRGFWQAIDVRSRSDDNRFHHVLVSGAGGGDQGAGLYVTGWVSLENSLLRESATYGLALPTADARLTSFRDNAFRLNQAAPLYLPAEQMGALDGGSSYVGGNGRDFIQVWGGDITAAQTWPRTDGAFWLTSNVTISSAVTVDAGAHVVVASRQRLIVDTDGSFAAKGTAADSIRIRGEQPVPGHWDGLEVRSQSAQNLLDYVRIGHGGADGYADVWLTGRVTVSNSHVHDSLTWGIDRVGSAAVLDLDANTTFAGNVQGNVD